MEPRPYICNDSANGRKDAAATSHVLRLTSYVSRLTSNVSRLTSYVLLPVLTPSFPIRVHLWRKRGIGVSVFRRVGVSGALLLLRYSVTPLRLGLPVLPVILPLVSWRLGGEFFPRWNAVSEHRGFGVSALVALFSYSDTPSLRDPVTSFPSCPLCLGGESSRAGMRFRRIVVSASRR
jgi:hypothetical protein